MKIGSCRITLADQEMFASFSGDFNPLHLDPAIARRSPFGQIVVHGMHSALRALEAYAGWSREGERGNWGRLSVTFAKPIFLDEEIDVDISRTEGKVRLSLRIGSAELLRATLDRPIACAARAATSLPALRVLPEGYGGRSPRLRSRHETEGLEGVLAVTPPAGQAAALFPCCTDWLGDSLVGEVARLSAIVGMEWPGLHSLLARAVLDLTPADPPVAGPRSAGVSYRVLHVDPHRAFTAILGAGTGFSARLEAFFRPPPVRQPAMADLAGRVGEGAFHGQVAYVVGGSRGLGELAAKLVAMGGGHPVVTYHTGREAAEGLARDIQAAGGSCTLAKLDVRDAEAAGALDGAPPPTMLLFFATPKIFRRRTEEFSMPLLHEFLDYYVEGFLRVVGGALARAEGPLAVFYPSTAAIGDPAAGLAEYAAAKAAGEVACAHLGARGGALRLICERLPRLSTDQTNSIVPFPAEDPVERMRDLLHRMAAAAHR